MRRAAAAMGLSVCLAACGTGSGGANPAVPDAAVPDAAVPDAAVPDAAVPDAAVPDAAPVDAAPDASPLPPLGGDRPARVILPSDWTPNQPWPLVVLLHGFRANGTLVDNQFGFSRQVDAQHFVLVVPEATLNAEGFTRWNTGPVGEFAPDDTAYLRGLVQDATARYAIDPPRVYVAGHSNGGGMAYHLACAANDLFAGVGALSATNDTLPQACPDGRPVNLLALHGDQDDQHVFETTPDHIGVDDTLRAYTSHLGCAEPPTTEAGLDFEGVVAGPETEILTWTGCRDGVTVQRWRLFGVGHIPIMTPAGSERLVGALLEMRRSSQP